MLVACDVVSTVVVSFVVVLSGVVVITAVVEATVVVTVVSAVLGKLVVSDVVETIVVDSEGVASVQGKYQRAISLSNASSELDTLN